MNMENPLVTVVTTTYKKLDSLFKTIDSVFEQTYPNIEYIIADDGSENFSESEISYYLNSKKSKNVKWYILHNKENVGTVRNINNAYKNAHGEYIYNLSCGDVYFEKETVRKLTERFIHTKCEVLVTSRILYKENFVPIKLIPHYDERKIIEKRKNSIEQYKSFIAEPFYDMASGSAMYFTRNIIEKIGFFDERYILWEDGPFLAKYMLNNKLEFGYDIISIWYEYGGLSTGSVKSEKLANDILLFNKTERIDHLELFTFWERRRILAILNKSLCINFLEKIICYLNYLPECMYSKLLKIKRKSRVLKDLRIINNLLKKRE